MKQTKINLGNVLLILAAIGFGFASYLSINFITLGDTKQSLIGALIISIILSGLAFGAQRFKKANRNFKTNIILEIIFLLLFIVAAYFAIQPFSHVFTVIQEKESINNKVGDNLDQAKNMFDEYEEYANTRIDTYETTLKGVVANKKPDPELYKAYGFNDERTDKKQSETKLFTIRAKLFPSNFANDTTQNQDGVKRAAVKWLEGVKSNVNGQFGFMFGIVHTVNEVPRKIEEWKTNLISLSKYRADKKNPEVKDFDYSLDFKEVKSQLTGIKSPTILSAFLALVLYVLMLSPYFASSRSTKSPFLSIIHFLLPSINKSKKDDDDDDINVRIGR